jgi:hypothetical protein
MMVPDPKGAAKAGREGFDLTFEKLNPLKKPDSEKFDQFMSPKKKKVRKK